jgi:hypothetical protein
VGHRCANDPTQQPGLERYRRTPAPPRHLGHRTPKVEVDVVDAVLADQPGHGLTQVAGVDAVELKAAGPLVGREVGEPVRSRAALDESAGGDHLAYTQPGSETPAERSEGSVGDPRHGSQDDRGRDTDRTEGECGKLPRRCGGDLAIDLASVARIHPGQYGR